MSDKPIYGTKKQSTDKKDGNHILKIWIPAVSIPELFLEALPDTLFRVEIIYIAPGSQIRASSTFLALKNSIEDGSKPGEATIALTVQTSAISRDLLFCPKGTDLELTIEAEKDGINLPYPSQHPERAKILQRLAIACNEEAFHSFLQGMKGIENLFEKQKPGVDSDIIASEMVLRLIGANTRSEILNSALVADRANILLAQYRQTRMQTINDRFGNETVAI